MKFLQRLTLTILFAINLPFLVIAMFFTVLIMYPLSFLIWLIKGSDFYDLFDFTFAPATFVLMLPDTLTNKIFRK